jgi:hypothetical protein
MSARSEMTRPAIPTFSPTEIVRITREMYHQIE